jgi:hypothetical protein
LTTVTLLIHAPDTMPQQEWHHYVFKVGAIVFAWEWRRRFSAGNPSNNFQRSWVWVFDIEDSNSAALEAELNELAQRFEQDPPAWGEGAFAWTSQ